MKILLAIQEKSVTLLDFVAHHRWDDDVQFNVVHVVELVAGTLPGFHGSPELLSSITDYGRQVLAFAVQRLKEDFPGAKIEISSPTGGPVSREILSLADSWRADAIVMGTHGRGALGRVFLGSVSLEVVSRANCDVYIIASQKNRAQAAA
jgi:nucleotide-binding universal stress UspA family protein